VCAVHRPTFLCFTPSNAEDAQPFIRLLVSARIFKLCIHFLPPTFPLRLSGVTRLLSAAKGEQIKYTEYKPRFCHITTSCHAKFSTTHDSGKSQWNSAAIICSFSSLWLANQSFLFALSATVSSITRGKASWNVYLSSRA